MGIDDLGKGLKDIAQRTPYVQNFFDNPEKGAKEKAWADAAKGFEGAMGTSDQRHADTLAQSMAYFKPVQDLLRSMYGQGAGGPVNEFFAPPGSGAGSYHGTPGALGNPDDYPQLQMGQTPPTPAGATWGATPPPPGGYSVYDAALRSPKKAP